MSGVCQLARPDTEGREAGAQLQGPLGSCKSDAPCAQLMRPAHSAGILLSAAPGVQGLDTLLLQPRPLIISLVTTQAVIGLHPVFVPCMLAGRAEQKLPEV